MKKIFTAVLVALLAFPSHQNKADEGMWLPMLIKRLNYDDMKRQGLKLTAEEIYSVNNSSLKDAVVMMGGGFCTGEMISSKGLLLTNHHCGYEYIQQNSSVDKDYLTDGFWAKSLDQELPNPGLTVSYLVRMEDVTAQVKKAFDGMTMADIEAKKRGIFKQIADEAVAGTHHDARIREFFHGNEFYLFVYETFKDVRFVGAPPSSIGVYGGDTDNWMWPRHTGDFSMFRVYMGADGKPAEYSKQNVPYKPKHHLPVNIDGVKEGDFTMVMGNPGRTQRFKTSEGLKIDYEDANPARIKIRERLLFLMKEDMDANDKVRIQYASKRAVISNYYKYFIGQNAGLKRLKTIEAKKLEEDAFQAWADKSGVEVYAKALPNINQAYSELKAWSASENYLFESGFSPEIMQVGGALAPLMPLLEKGDEAGAKTAAAGIKKGMEEFFKDYNMATDLKIATTLLTMYHKDIPVGKKPDIFSAIDAKYKGDAAKFVATMYAKTFLNDKAKLYAFLDNPTKKAWDKDMGLQYMQSIRDYMSKTVGPNTGTLNMKVTENMKHYVAGLMEMNKNKTFYPDANSTMRLSYGKVAGYKPQDGVNYNYFTTLDGIMAKEDASNPEFTVPAKLKEIYAKKDYGRYAEDGVMKACFITDNDITGGNSGSPVINAEGHLIGLAFDGNWEAMTGDLVYDKQYKRCINMDIRYVLLVIDKFAGATNLIDELTIVKTGDKSTIPAAGSGPNNK